MEPQVLQQFMNFWAMWLFAWVMFVLFLNQNKDHKVERSSLHNVISKQHNEALSSQKETNNILRKLTEVISIVNSK